MLIYIIIDKSRVDKIQEITITIKTTTNTAKFRISRDITGGTKILCTLVIQGKVYFRLEFRFGHEPISQVFHERTLCNPLIVSLICNTAVLGLSYYISLR